MIRVLLFAELEDAAGARELDLSLEEGTVSDVRAILKEKHPNLNAIDQAMPAVNEEYANGDDKVKAGDTIAFIPPVSGG
ncbi:molybdopterin converting factor subunit 1 [Alteribacter aurantiacus]|uniref:molybdopterin converting factor subunit 1 n=1 Tax=Alteribacter aurantiacus TaxID=254410 RepID=UPI000405B4F3|nr:molybdopterin converting factor subunit 1 [Alteribacter aurantiacus]